MIRYGGTQWPGDYGDLNRPEARNAVNGPTAAALYAAFEQFDRDDTASVAVLWGEGGTFCAGADLKAFGTPEPTRCTGRALARWARRGWCCPNP